MIHQQPNTRQALCFLSQFLYGKTNKSYSVSHQVFLLSLSLTPEFLLARFTGTE
ncbi:hypothetical protein HanHA300_Chr15g0552741 [Helianthus annuus]|nr:hypothetical protein HanHA300_Chr15g0552741 [Helianthus annuus]